MRELGILLLFCMSAAIAEIVYLDDVTGDHDKRNLRLGLPETMQFRLRRAGNDVRLNLRENKHLNPNAPIYESVKDDNGQSQIVRNTNIKPVRNVRYYQDLDNGAYIRAECKKTEGGPCARLLACFRDAIDSPMFLIRTIARVGNAYLQLNTKPDYILTRTGNLFVNGKEHSLEPALDELNKRQLNLHTGIPHNLELLTVSKEFLAAAEHARGKRAYRNPLHARRSVNARDAENSNNNDYGNETLIRDKRAPPVAHGVEVLVVLDHTIYEDFAPAYNWDESVTKYRIREYFAHVMNGHFCCCMLSIPQLCFNSVVILWFSEMLHWLIFGTQPSKTLHFLYIVISGFFISTNVADSPWMNYNQDPTNAYNGVAFMNNWRTNPVLPGHDHATLLTRTDISDQRGDRFVMGIAWLAGACRSVRTSVAEDHGLFKTSSLLAHEIGHNIGSHHDGENGQCNAWDSYIMAPQHDNMPDHIKEFRFSSCAVNWIKAYLINDLGANSCTLTRAAVYDEDEFDDFTDDLAGKHFSLDDQCVLYKGAGATYCGSNRDTSAICKNFYCKAPGGSCDRYGAGDGTPCGYDSICYESTCQKPDVCRYRPMDSTDIAKDYQVVWQSSEHGNNPRPASLAVDGSLDTISHTKSETYPWWKLRFSSPKSIYAVKIWNRKDCCGEQLGKLWIRVDDTACGHQLQGPLPLKSCFEVTCSNGPIVGTDLLIQQFKFNTPLNIAEVQVFAACYAPDEIVEYSYRSPLKPFYRSSEVLYYECDTCSRHLEGDLNRTCTVAGSWTNSPPMCLDEALYMPNTEIRYKNATQSSEDSNLRPATLALDGLKDTISHTGIEDSPSWQMEFCTETRVSAVRIWNRRDCCQHQLSGIHVTVDGITCGTYDGPTDQIVMLNINCETSLTGKILKITRTKQQSMLNLAEVEISGQSCSEQQSNANIATAEMYISVTQSSEANNQQANLAVDGDFNTFSLTGEDFTPYWQIEFCSTVSIGRVRVYQVDAGQDLFIGALVDGEIFGFFIGNVNAGDYFEITARPMDGTTLRITRPEDNAVDLKLAEVQVFDS